MGDTGLESLRDSAGKRGVAESGGNKSGNKDAPGVVLEPIDPGLSEVVAAWPTLPPAIRAGVVALVKAAGVKP